MSEQLGDRNASSSNIESPEDGAKPIGAGRVNQDVGPGSSDEAHRALQAALARERAAQWARDETATEAGRMAVTSTAALQRADEAATRAAEDGLSGATAELRLADAESTGFAAIELGADSLAASGRLAEAERVLSVATSDRRTAEQVVRELEQRDQLQLEEQTKERILAELRTVLAEINSKWFLFQPTTTTEQATRREVVLESLNLLRDWGLRRNIKDTQDLREVLSGFNDTASQSNEILDELGSILRRAKLDLPRTRNSAAIHHEFDSLIRRVDEEVIERRQAEALARIKSAEAEATDAAESAKKAAGTAGDAVLTGHFATYADSESIRSYVYLGGAVLSLLAALGGAAVVLWGGAVGDFGWQEGLKALVTLPIVALAYYMSRQSSIHSETSRRAREIEVRLKTVEAYTSAMPSDEAQQIRASLGDLIYGGADVVALDAVNDLGKETTEAIAAIKEIASTALKELASVKKAADKP